MISDATEKELVFLNLYYLYASVREPGGLGHIVSHRDTIWHALLIFYLLFLVVDRHGQVPSTVSKRTKLSPNLNISIIFKKILASKECTIHFLVSSDF